MKNKITLATLPQATEQEVFDQVATHLLTQLRKSVGDSMGLCKYRGEDGLMCAAGCLIADDEYDPVMDEMDTTAWVSLVKDGFVPNTHMELIQELQHIHDRQGYVPARDWKSALEDLAIERGLEFKGGEYVRSISSN